MWITGSWWGRGTVLLLVGMFLMFVDKATSNPETHDMKPPHSHIYTSTHLRTRGVRVDLWDHIWIPIFLFAESGGSYKKGFSAQPVDSTVRESAEKRAGPSRRVQAFSEDLERTDSGELDWIELKGGSLI